MTTSEADREALLARLFGAEQIPPTLNTELLRTRDVARAFQVSERTIAEWARRGRIPSVRTPGGHRLYPAERIREILRQAQDPTTEFRLTSPTGMVEPAQASGPAMDPLTPEQPASDPFSPDPFGSEPFRL